MNAKDQAEALIVKLRNSYTEEEILQNYHQWHKQELEEREGAR